MERDENEKEWQGMQREGRKEKNRQRIQEKEARNEKDNKTSGEWEAEKVKVCTDPKTQWLRNASGKEEIVEVGGEKKRQKDSIFAGGWEWEKGGQKQELGSVREVILRAL